jgi:hypothetical protein
LGLTAKRERLTYTEPVNVDAKHQKNVTTILQTKSF